MFLGIDLGTRSLKALVLDVMQSAKLAKPSAGLILARGVCVAIIVGVNGNPVHSGIQALGLFFRKGIAQRLVNLDQGLNAIFPPAASGPKISR